MSTLGVLANPASGKDVRRLVARASVFDNQEKRAIVQRAIAGAVAAGIDAVHYFDDAHGIARGAVAEHPGINATPIELDVTGTALDTIASARALRAAACDAVLLLGGDGTSRAFTLGWPDASLLPLSTGTNNVFPELIEATVGGTAAGLVASNAVPNTTPRCKTLHIHIDGEHEDLALIDAVLTSDRFVGSRALLDATRLRHIVLTRADPTAVGMAAIGGMLDPISSAEDEGLTIDLAAGGTPLHALIAPGLYADVPIAGSRRLPLNDSVTWTGPGVIALDGERERFLKPGQTARVSLARQGPRVIDIARVMRCAQQRGLFRRAGDNANNTGGTDAH